MGAEIARSRDSDRTAKPQRAGAGERAGALVGFLAFC